MTDETTLNYVNELQAYMVRVIKLEAEIERLREALERIAVGMMPPETIEGWRNLAMERVDIARAALDARGLEIREKNDD